MSDYFSTVFLLVSLPLTSLSKLLLLVAVCPLNADWRATPLGFALLEAIITPSVITTMFITIYFSRPSLLFKGYRNLLLIDNG